MDRQPRKPLCTPGQPLSSSPTVLLPTILCSVAAHPPLHVDDNPHPHRRARDRLSVALCDRAVRFARPTAPPPTSARIQYVYVHQSSTCTQYSLSASSQRTSGTTSLPSSPSNYPPLRSCWRLARRIMPSSPTQTGAPSSRPGTALSASVHTTAPSSSRCCTSSIASTSSASDSS